MVAGAGERNFTLPFPDFLCWVLCSGVEVCVAYHHIGTVQHHTSTHTFPVVGPTQLVPAQGLQT